MSFLLSTHMSMHKRMHACARAQGDLGHNPYDYATRQFYVRLAFACVYVYTGIHSAHKDVQNLLESLGKNNA